MPTTTEQAVHRLLDMESGILGEIQSRLIRRAMSAPSADVIAYEVRQLTKYAITTIRAQSRDEE